MTNEQIRNKLKFYNLSAVAKDTGYSYFKIWRFVTDRTDDQEVKEVLEGFLNDQEGYLRGARYVQRLAKRV